MSRMPKAWIGCGTIFSLVALLGCSEAQDKPSSSLLTAGSPCVSEADQLQSANGLSDQREPQPGDRVVIVNAEPIPGADSDYVIRRVFAGLASATVVAREPAVAVSDQPGRAAIAHREQAPTPSGSGFSVVRPARLEVNQVFRGGPLPTCLHLDIPGGSSGSYHLQTGAFPDNFAVGDRLLLIFSPSGPAGFGSIIKADQEGRVRLPFVTPTTVDLDTWQPPPYEGLTKVAPSVPK